MAAPSPTTSHSAVPPAPAASASSPSEPPAASPSPVEADDTESPTDASHPSPAVSPSSNSLSIPPPPPLLAPPPSVTPAAAAPPPQLPLPPTSSLNYFEIAPRPISPQNPPSRSPSAAPPRGDAPPPLLLSPPAPAPSHAVKAPKGSPQALLASPSTPPLKPSSSSSPPVVVSANAGAPTAIHDNFSEPRPADIAVTHSRFNTGDVVGIGTGVGSFIVLSFICLVVWCKCRRRRKISGFDNTNIRISLQSPPTSDASVMKIHSSAPLIGTSSSRNDSIYSPPEEHLPNARPWFTFEQLGNATNWFSAENLIGEGGCTSSHVYKGCLPNGQEIAVKQQPVYKDGAIQASEQEFKAELEIISRVHHRHLVSLVGYCITDDNKFLVYDYIPNNTLYFHLHSEDCVVLNWAKRIRIAVGAARGIAYLHEDCCPRIIHGDIKSSNILLDNNYEAWVSDFGLAKIAPNANTCTHVTSRIMGTFGYMAPEYASSGELTEKSDVYSFGVVLLELITGKKPIDISLSLGDVGGLVEWARPLLNRALENEEFEGLVDPRLDNNKYVKSEMFRMIEAAAACLQHSAAKRPRMGQVVRIFNNVGRLDLMNGMRFGASEVFNADEQSREIEALRRMQLRSHGYSTEYFSL